jgi:hypothetical protein
MSAILNNIPVIRGFFFDVTTKHTNFTNQADMLGDCLLGVSFNPTGRSPWA